MQAAPRHAVARRRDREGGTVSCAQQVTFPVAEPSIDRFTDSRLMILADYRIEKYRTPLVIWTVDGERVAGEVFLQPSQNARAGPETVGDLLNAVEPFFPMRCDNGAIRFVSKQRVAEALVASETDGEERSRAGARSAVVEVVLATREPFVGCIYYEVPSARPRLLDFLNRQSQQFLRVHTDDGLRLVNRDLISGIRPLD